MPDNSYTAFVADSCIATGELYTMLVEVKKKIGDNETDPLLIFHDQTGKQIDFDLRGTPEEVLARLATHPMLATAESSPQPRSGPGRPSLGVVSREVSLLPRHWEWLSQQPAGASGTLRRLVDDERKRGAGKERARQAWEAAGKFMWVMAGNKPGFEEASRALYAKDIHRLTAFIQNWPPDIRDHIQKLIDFAQTQEATSILS